MSSMVELQIPCQSLRLMGCEFLKNTNKPFKERKRCESFALEGFIIYFITY